MAESNYREALATLNSMYNQFELTEEQENELAGLQEYIHFLQQLENEENNIYELSESKLAYLENYVQTHTGRGVVFANNILCELYGICIEATTEVDPVFDSEKNTTSCDTISFTWEGKWASFRSCKIIASSEKRFTIDWGDGSNIDTITGTGDWQWIRHTYSFYDNNTVVIAGIGDDCYITGFDSDYGSQISFLHPLTNISLSKCQSLEILKCNANKLNELDLSECSLLKVLECNTNLLTELDLNKCKLLKIIKCSDNQLSELDLRECKLLEDLDCSRNKLKVLDLSECEFLLTINCAINQLTELDLSKNNFLQELNCTRNFLFQLDLGECNLIANLICSWNLLSKLDLRECKLLKSINCSNNKLTELDLSECKLLGRLYCFDNQLTELDFINSEVLQIISCYNNSFLLSDLYKTSLMISNSDFKLFGLQTISPQVVIPGYTIDYSSQNEFGGILTDFSVEKNGFPASSQDYHISDGFLTFYTNGNYKLTMTNSAIVSSPRYPAEVITEFFVNLDIFEAYQEKSKIRIFPNPTTGELIIDNEELKIENIEVFDIYGRKQKIIINYQLPIVNSINISHLRSGTYFVRMVTEQGKIVRKVVKQ